MMDTTPADVGLSPESAPAAALAWKKRGAVPWANIGLRWLGITAAAFGITLLGLIAILRPSAAHIAVLVLCLGVSSIVSIGLGAASLWLVDAAHIGGIRLKLAIPPLLTAFVIAFNVLLIARMMFISTEDSQLLLAFLIFGILVALLLASVIGTEMSRLILGLETGARRIADGDYAYRLPEHHLRGAQELTQLARWFNQMAASVQVAFERQHRAEAERRHVLTSVSHDLRTPLASIRAMVEAIDDGVVRDPAMAARYQHTIRAEVTHLSALIDELFELSRLESGTLTLHRETVALDDLISDAIEAAHEQAEQAHISLRGEIAGALPLLEVDARQIYRALVNLLQNALRHTPAGGAIVIAAAECAHPVGSRDAGQHVRIRVIDTGEGIRASDLPHVFERMYRGETARTRLAAELPEGRQGGAGLGLAIAKGIVEAHGGTISAHSPLPPDAQALVAQLRPPAQAMSQPGAMVGFTLPC
jgi:signal transduction histidine kinase